MLRTRRQKVVAIAAGVLFAGACLSILNPWIDQLAAGLALNDLQRAAERKLALAENRIARVVATLVELDRQGVESCQLETLRRAVFSNVMIKEISLLSPDGQTLCATSGLATGSRRLLSSYHAPSAQNLAIEVLSFEDNEKVLRLRRMNGNATSLGALLMASTLIAQSSPEASELPGYRRLEMPDGTLIGESGSTLDISDGAPLSVNLASERYRLSLTMLLPRSTSRAHKARILMLGSAAAGAFGILLLMYCILRPGRQRENPIAELEHALAAGEFVPYYQPVIDLVSGKLRGAEVLIRRRKPDGSLVSPAVFIPLAESSGIILDMTRALMRRVCQEIGPAYAERPHLKISFNLAARHFEDEAIVRDVREIFGRGSVRLSQVVLELTERQPIENLVKTRRLIATLQGLGVRMAIDDVGTGHSGLSYILKLGVDIIKIDKMFVDAIGIERSSTTIIETLIDLAHNMRMDIVAEGVETFEQVVCLRDRGIRAAQGFVFAPPLPGASFLQLIEAIEPVAPAEPAGKPEPAALDRAVA